MRVVVADDQPDVRSALRLMIEEKSGIAQVSEASSAQELLAMVRSDCPDLVLLDFELPGTRPEELLKTLRLLCSDVNIIALSSRPQMKQIALGLGADDFVCKSDPPEMLLDAINRY
ncbi:MAG: response regulator transcription factor [Dehalococcoidales bacterium]|nr:response regulator transcription factor [Dehalococcoidales bacterium]